MTTITVDLTRKAKPNWKYVRVRLIIGEDKTAVNIWAKKLEGQDGVYFRVNRDGVEPTPRNMYLVDRADVVWEKDAKMDNFYGELIMVGSEHIRG